MLHKLKHKLNRIKYYFKLLNWAREHSERVSSYRFLLDLKTNSHNNYLEAQRKEKKERMVKAEIQEELLDKILNKIKI